MLRNVTLNCTTLSVMERFELVADLYYRHFGRLAPGKSEPMETGRSSSDDENRSQFAAWVNSGQILEDALIALSKAYEIIAEQSNLIDDLESDVIEAGYREEDRR